MFENVAGQVLGLVSKSCIQRNWTQQIPAIAVLIKDEFIWFVGRAIDLIIVKALILPVKLKSVSKLFLLCQVQTFRTKGTLVPFVQVSSPGNRLLSLFKYS